MGQHAMVAPRSRRSSTASSQSADIVLASNVYEQSKAKPAEESAAANVKNRPRLTNRPQLRRRTLIKGQTQNDRQDVLLGEMVRALGERKKEGKANRPIAA